MRRQILGLTIVITCIFFSCSSNQNNNLTSDTTSTDTNVEAPQSSKQPSKENVENWIIEKLKRYSKEIKDTSRGATDMYHTTSFVDFNFTNNALVIKSHKLTQTAMKFPKTDGKEEEIPVLDIDCDIETIIYLTDFKEIGPAVGKNSSLVFVTESKGIVEVDNCTTTGHNPINGTSTTKKDEPNKTSTLSTSIGFDTETEKDILTRLDSAFKTLRDKYLAKETF